MRVLFLTHRLPYAPNRGDRIRAYHTLRALRDHAQVELVSLVHDRAEAAGVEAVRDVADRVHLAPVGRLRNRIAAAYSLAAARPLTHALLDSPALVPMLRRIVAERRPDVVLALCSGMARFAIEPPLAGLPLVIDLVDVDSLKWKTLAARTAYPMRWIYRHEGRWLSRFEARAARCAFATVVVNDRERAALRELVPEARIEIAPVGVDCDYFRPPSVPSGAPRVVFCGVMAYGPNAEGAIWLGRDVWPLVRRRVGDARLTIVGSQPTAEVRKLAEADSSITVTGDVRDIRPHLWDAAVATAPLQVARGVQTKVLEAVAAGLPVIVTPGVARGLPSEILSACRIAGDAAEFSTAIVDQLALAPSERRAIAAGADLSCLSWNHQLAPLMDLLHAAARWAIANAEARGPMRSKR